MEVTLYNSSICRLCSEENENGSLLYVDSDENPKLCDVINTYLPIKVSDDGILPRTICPGCTIQLEATTDFINLIINGQKILRELFEREKEYKKSLEVTVEEVITDNVVYDINSTDGVYQADHPITLEVAGLDKPKRKRGRPPKKTKTPEELAREEEIRERERQEMARRKQNEDVNGKRKRKAPTRLQEAVQGKELEKIFKEEGVIDEEESEPEPVREQAPEPSQVLEVIGHVASSGEPVLVNWGKGRGRPKGRARRRVCECAICGMNFASTGRYMSHVAAHRQTKNLNKLKLNEDPEGVDPPKIDVQESSESSEPKKAEETFEILNIVNDVSNDEAEKFRNVNTDEVKETDKKDEGTTIDITAEAEGGACAEIVEDEEKIEMKYKCSYCPKTFSSRQSKSLHIKAVHLGERRYCCAECGARFAYPRSLKLHAVTHRRARSSAFGCDICGKVLNHPSSIIYHKEAAHAGHCYVCRKCGKAFKHRQLLQRHQLVHTHARPFNCSICNAVFKTKANLTNHQLLHTGVKRFTCEICKHKFAHKTSLTLHMRWHIGLKPYSCGTCGKLFSQKGNLLEHERIHTGEKPFVCDLCPRRFTTSSQCALHVRRHKGAQPLRYTDCPRAQSNAKRKRRRRRSEPIASPAHLALEVHSPPPEENVVYVTYDVDDPDALRMLQVEEVGSVMGEHVPVTDAHGNPLHFTMSDGTQLPITSSDGNTLQVITQDGQTLPVEIDGYTNEEDVDNAEIVIHQLDPQKNADVGDALPLTQYFTQ